MNMANILEKKYSFKSYSESTLRDMTRDELIEEIRVLEHNWASAELVIERQSELIERIKRMITF